MNNSIAFIFCYARSGGTFLNRFLSNIDSLVVLSEVHPIHNKKGGIYSVKEQAKEWYGIDVKSEDYLEQIKEVKRWCDENNKHLVIRDWSYIDFTKSYLNNNKPIYQSTNLLLLEKCFNVNKIAFIRDAIDICLSQNLKPSDFSFDYLQFTQYIVKNNIKFFKYESFRDNPLDVYNKIALELKIPLLNSLKADMFASQNVVGDLNLSRGNVSTDVVKLKRRYASKNLQKLINDDKYLNNANKLFGYSSIYESIDSEVFREFIIFKIRKIISKSYKIIKKLKNVFH
ncbi:hypothetical protein [Sulfurimonas indica]|uniref:hypothetical protein n=1 Tax=Sulfurimonas indica TaxID=2508707 RepID=UPI0012659601|nr:hypothetical protein [Sulfurimonas indica]